MNTEEKSEREMSRTNVSAQHWLKIEIHSPMALRMFNLVLSVEVG